MSNQARPAPPNEPPEGYEWVAAPDPYWRIEAGKRCRLLGGRPLRGCGADSVAAFNRGGWRGRQNWWAYCEDHLFGRWIEDGVVHHWILGEQGGGETRA